MKVLDRGPPKETEFYFNVSFRSNNSEIAPRNAHCLPPFKEKMIDSTATCINTLRHTLISVFLRLPIVKRNSRDRHFVSGLCYSE